MKLQRATAIAAIAAAGSGLAGCPPGLSDPDRFLNECPSGVSVEAMFRDKCAGSGCHGADSPAAGLDLVTDGAFARMLGAPSSACGAGEIAASGPEDSALVQKIEGASACGARMPLGGEALSPGEITCVKEWIAAGLDAGVTAGDAGSGGAGGGG